MNGRRVAGALLMLVLAAGAVRAQEPVRVTPQGVLINFQSADLRVVFAGLAEAGGINLLYGELPNRPVTLQMQNPVARDAILPLIRNLARSNGLVVTEEGGFFRIETSDRAGATAARASGDTTGDTETRLFVYHLRHARATRLGATLQTVFGGASTAGAGPQGLREVSLSEGLSDQRRATAAPAPAPATTSGSAGSLPGRLHGEVQIVPDEGTNSLLVRAEVGDWPVIETAIGELDQRPAQVLIEVLIAEVRRSSGLDVSVSGKTGNNATNPTATGELLGGASESNGALLLQLLRAGSTDQRLLMSLLASRGDVRVVSRPVLLAQNNLEARVLVGSQRPFVQVQRSLPNDQGSRDQLVQYRDVGTKLTILPTINGDGYVNLEVLQEVSNATEKEAFNAPIIDTREAATHLFLKDGQTGVIAGLVDRQVETTRSGIPLLMDIPVLGWLFGTTKRTNVTSELFLFLTPYVLNDDADIDRVRNAIDRNSELLRTVLPGVRPLITPDSAAAPIVTPPAGTP